MTHFEIFFWVVITANVAFALWKYLPHYKTPIERWTSNGSRETYNRETENTLINIGAMSSDDTHYCAMMLAEIYQELRRQGIK